MRPAHAYPTEHAWRVALLERLLVQHIGAAPDGRCMLSLYGSIRRSVWHRLSDIESREVDYVHAIYDTLLEHMQSLTSPAPH